MIVGFSKHGKGGGGPAVDYLTKGEGRETAPTVLSGDPELIQQRIDQNPNEWKYTSGVLSFAPEDVVTEAQERELIATFEDTAFAGIDPENRPQGLWVRHEHAGHHEMHFLYSRQLNDDRAYNMRPPGDQARWDTFRDTWNHAHGWADPDDPRRARALSVPDHALKAGKGKDAREIIHDWAADRIAAGVIDNRAELVQQLQEQGFNVPRQGKNYLTIEAGGERIRLKGELFAQSFQSRESVRQHLETRTADYQRSLPEKLARARERLEQFNAKRAEQNQERFAKPREAQLLEKRAREHRDLSGFLDRELGLDAMAGQAVGMDKQGLGRGQERAGPDRSQNFQREGHVQGREMDGKRWDALDKGNRKDGPDGQQHGPMGRGIEGLNYGRTDRAREGINRLRKAVDSCIGRTKQAADGRKQAIMENVPRAAELIGRIQRAGRRLGERATQLKTAAKPAIAKLQEQAKIKARSISKGMGFSR